MFRTFILGWIQYYDGRRLAQPTPFGMRGFATSRAFTCNPDGTTSGVGYVTKWSYD